MSGWTWGLGPAPAIVHAGRWPRSWADAWGDETTTWVRVADRVHPLPVVTRVVSGVDRAIADERWVVDRGGVRDLGPRVRAGLDVTLTRRRPGGWATGFPLPRTPRVSPTTRPFPRGVGVAWHGDGMVCTATPDRRQARATWSGRWQVGPHGALALGDDTGWTHAAAPSRTPRRLAVPLDGPLRWSDDGTRVRGRELAVDLRSGEVAEHPPLPCGAPARHGDRLAGPDARVWDLRTGDCSADALVGDAFTVGGPRGWLTVDRDGHARWLRPDGALLRTVVLPLSEPDRIDRGAPLPEGFRVWSTLGGCWVVTARGVGSDDAPRPRRARTSRVHVGDHLLRLAGEHTVDGRRWGWTRDGWLGILPRSPDQRGISYER